jgi:radical SAM superfamily enzyme YgiQ (UPF0313 family)
VTSITIVQQGVWHMAKESMPLAAGYLASCIRADERLKHDCDVAIENFSGTASPLEMAIRLLRDGCPDVIGFSVLGWNFRQFSAVAEAIKQVNPAALIVFGGTHVANQAERVFRQCPQVDIVVNGEGEFTFKDIIAHRAGMTPLDQIAGISYRASDGTVRTTAERARILDLDTIPSPILTGAVPLTRADGAFRYDVALMETNRGCPYQCAFCYWGGAIGQKVRSFSRQRLRAELEAVARAGAATVVLCDANFGMLKQDMEFVEDLIEIRNRYGFPLALETSWAKNKNATFYDIVKLMKKEGLQTSFTLALQTLDDDTLKLMKRKNMKINDWKDLAAWLSDEGVNAYAELIWGAPGQTRQSFLDGYDELAKYVTRIAAYPLLLLPNTDFTDRRREHGFVTVRGERDDFEYVLANRTVTIDQNLEMIRFLFWARLLSENLVLRALWPALRATIGMRQSEAILSIADHIEASPSEVAAVLRDAARSSFADPDSLAPALELCYVGSGFDLLIRDWWSSVLRPEIPDEWRTVLDSVVRYDLETRPMADPAHRGFDEAAAIDVGGVKHWEVVRSYDFDVPSFIARAEAPHAAAPHPELREHRVRLRFRQGFGEFARSTNHEVTAHYVAKVELLAEEGAAPPRSGGRAYGDIGAAG